MFHPAIVDDLENIQTQARQTSSPLDIQITPYGGHVGYFSNQSGRPGESDTDPWWAWNRILDWVVQSRAAVR